MKLTEIVGTRRIFLELQTALLDQFDDADIKLTEYGQLEANLTKTAFLRIGRSLIACTDEELSAKLTVVSFCEPMYYELTPLTIAVKQPGCLTDGSNLKHVDNWHSGALWFARELHDVVLGPSFPGSG